MKYEDELLPHLVEAIKPYAPTDALHASPVPRVHCIKFSQVSERSKRRWRACLGIVAQGSKEITLNRSTIRVGGSDFTATPIDLPVVTRIASARPASPFLGLLIDLDPGMLAEISAQVQMPQPTTRETRPAVVHAGKASDKMLEAALRLLELFSTPSDARILGPLVIKEAIFHLFESPMGGAIQQFVRAGSKTHQVYQAIHQLQSSLGDDLNIGGLSKAANMSRSAFFQHFKAVTTVSPIQYQKRLRLLEARRMLEEEKDGRTIGVSSRIQQYVAI